MKFRLLAFVFLITLTYSCTVPRERKEISNNTQRKETSPMNLNRTEKVREIVSNYLAKQEDDIEKEITLSKAIIDIKHLAKETLENGNIMLSLSIINEGAKIAPFRGDIVSLKAKILKENILFTNQIINSSKNNCEVIRTRMSVLKSIAPDKLELLDSTKKKCPFISFKNLETFEFGEIENLKDGDNFQVNPFNNVIIYSYSERDLYLSGLKKLAPLILKSIYIKHSEGKVTPELTYSYGRQDILKNYCDEIESILSYTGPNSKVLACGNRSIEVTPKTFHEIDNYFYKQTFIPKALIIRTTLSFQDGRAQDIWGNGQFKFKGFNNAYHSIGKKYLPEDIDCFETVATGKKLNQDKNYVGCALSGYVTFYGRQASKTKEQVLDMVGHPSISFSFLENLRMRHKNFGETRKNAYLRGEWKRLINLKGLIAVEIKVDIKESLKVYDDIWSKNNLTNKQKQSLLKGYLRKLNSKI